MVSPQMRSIGESTTFIREAYEFAKARAKVVGPENVFDFSLGNPSTPPPRAVLETLDELMGEEPILLHGYTSTPGNEDTRQAVADAMNRRYNAALTADAVTMVGGASTALTASFKALTVDEETEFLAIAPYFTEYAYYSTTAGAQFRFVPADTENFQIDFDALEAMINVHTQAVIVNTPNNPSGAVYTRDTLTRLAALLKRKSAELGRPVYIMSDEPYREIYYGEGFLPFIPTIYDDTVVCYSYSKCFSMPGERIGYILLPDTLTEVEALRAAVRGALRSQGHVCAPSTMQRLVTRCADAMPDLEPYRRNRDLVYGALTEMGYRCVRPMGAFYLFVEAPGGDAMAFCRRAREKDVMLVPGDPFGCPGYVRLSYCVPGQRIERALPRLRELID